MDNKREWPKQTHVVKIDNWWAVKKENSKRITKIAKTKKEAIEIARKISNNQETELIIHTSDGSFWEKDSNWNDPKSIHW